MGTGRALIDLTGRRIGRLSVLRLARKEKVYPDKTTTKIVWLCLCDCGREVEVTGSSLRANQKSCGCAKPELCAEANIKHGGSMRRSRGATPEYRAWCKIKERCHNPTDKAFVNYGGRGIEVCAEWRNDFPRFLADMGPKPSRDHQIERINNDGPYSPTNCKWATSFEQANNKRNNVFIECGGKRQTIAQWAHELGMKPMTLQNRLARGWTVYRALTQEVKKAL